MAPVDYTLKNLRDRIKDDFGIDDALMDTIIDRKINDAQAWVIRRRQNWPWLSKTTVIDVPAAVTGDGDFLKGSRNVANIGTITVALRDILTTQTDSGDATSGFLVVTLGSPNDVVNKQYLDADETNKVIRQVQKWFQLPADFGTMEMVTVEGDLQNPTVDYKTVDAFERIEQRLVIHSLIPKIYTVTQDPLSTVANKYLAIYPYLGDITTLHCKYFYIPDVLSADGDIPVMPHEDRMLLFYGASWFLAQQQKEAESAVFYRDLALQELQQVTQKYGFADDPGEDDDILADPTQWVAMPPEFGEMCE